MDLVVHQVDQLEHVDVADRDRLLERLTRPSVDEIVLAVSRRRPAFLQQQLLRHGVQLCVGLAAGAARALLLKPELQADAARLAHHLIVEDEVRVLLLVLEPLADLLCIDVFADAVRAVSVLGAVHRSPIA